MQLRKSLKKLFKKCDHEGIQHCLSDNEYVTEVYVWKKGEPKPDKHYYDLLCPKCHRRVLLGSWVD